MMLHSLDQILHVCLENYVDIVFFEFLFFLNRTNLETRRRLMNKARLKTESRARTWLRLLFYSFRLLPYT